MVALGAGLAGLVGVAVLIDQLRTRAKIQARWKSMLIMPGAKGELVAALDRELQERGMLPPEAKDEVAAQFYGPITQGAVLTFQAKAGLKQDMIVGDRTWKALASGGEPAPAPSSMPEPDYAHMAPISATALREADSWWKAGVVEVPPGSNRGPEIDFWIKEIAPNLLQYKKVCPCAGDGFQGPPWCAIFAHAMVRHACKKLGLPCPTDGAGPLSQSMSWLTWGKKVGRFSMTPRPGNVGVIPGAEGHGHTVMVATVDKDKISTREGNSGQKLNARWRPISAFGGFVDVG